MQMTLIFNKKKKHMKIGEQSMEKLCLNIILTKLETFKKNKQHKSTVLYSKYILKHFKNIIS